MSQVRVYGIRTAGILAATVALLVGCEGDNLFQNPPGPGGGAGPGNDRLTPSVTILEPAGDTLKAKLIGDSIFIRVSLSDDVGIDSVRMFGVAERGDTNLGTDEIIERYEEKMIAFGSSTRDTVVTRFLRATPDTTKESVSVVVEAFDAAANISADTVRLFLGGPDVEILDFEGGETILADREVGVRIRGIDPGKIGRIDLLIEGAFTETLSQTFTNPGDTVLFEQTFATPPGVVGQITLTARATNALNLVGQDGPITVELASGSVQDFIPPNLRVEFEIPERLELQDSVKVTVIGSDDARGSGIRETGLLLRSISMRGDTLDLARSQTFTTPRSGTVVSTFRVGADELNIDQLMLPDTLIFEITGSMVDAAGNCSASVSGQETEPLVCVSLPGGGRLAEAVPGARSVRSVVAGRTVLLENPGRIMDAVVDVNRRTLLLSNISRSQLEVFRIPEQEFLPPVPVGSEPWGLAFQDDDHLFVGNSGGTNVSRVFLGNPQGLGAVEIPGDRLLTPDAVLFDVEVKLDDTGRVRYDADLIPDETPPGFSDRAQFIAVDSVGRVVYSTKTTLLGDFGTARVAFEVPGGEAPEVILLTNHGELLEAPDFFAVERIDGVATTPTGPNGEDLIVFFDHVIGFPSQVITSDPLPIEDAFQDIRNKGSDIRMFSGRWSVPNLGFQDTTFVAASTDGGWVAFGEGASDPVGIVLMYNTAVGDVVRAVRVPDLLTNASETVRGLAMNHDGTLGVALGSQAYFFNNDLRLQGVSALPPGGSGAALHPLHANYPSLENQDGDYDPNTHLAFFGTGENTIEIIDAFHFFRRGRIFIRDNIVAPLKAVLPFPEDNAGLTCQTMPVFNGSGDFIGESVQIFDDPNGFMPISDDLTDPACVAVKLFGITTSGGVAIVEVRKSDILRDLVLLEE